MNEENRIDTIRPWRTKWDKAWNEVSYFATVHQMKNIKLYTDVAWSGWSDKILVQTKSKKLFENQTESRFFQQLSLNMDFHDSISCVDLSMRESNFSIKKLRKKYKNFGDKNQLR